MTETLSGSAQGSQEPGIQSSPEAQGTAGAHTPGPWTARVLRSRGRYTIDVLEKRNRRGSSGQERATVVAWPGFDSCDQTAARTVANARLIAAAPDLLAALKEAERILSDCEPDENFNDDSPVLSWRAAISKAEGR